MKQLTQALVNGNISKKLWSLSFMAVSLMVAGQVSSSEFDAAGFTSIKVHNSIGRELNTVGNMPVVSGRIGSVAELGAQRLNQLHSTTGIKSVNRLKTREEVINAHKKGFIPAKYKLQKVKGNSQSDVPSAFANPIYNEFAIYEASSRLFEDNDYDGFYQTFSVTFDADVYGYYPNQPAEVYAEMYLSRDGGPWVHYYTTDIFTVVGDSTEDDFEVLTTLNSGYPADYYDVLIDLYEVGYTDIVATVNSDDFASLYALPLESSDRDYIDNGNSSSEGHGGGSMSFIALLGLGLFVRFRATSKVEKAIDQSLSR
ncbi:choice-of-anchor H family protein [Shewanella sp. D64]|uniref:choice-of-anchor H family protein n=1 Tax=unclassified Shewanella TaxID=196818 RepID=UPI0022BA26FD|nr:MULTISPECIES: choice-of-anchor H family protein [unclassified Shewanella]MEC4729075.1 choice-of-anchor H family protein [Shewanella sp. D64]MEC4739795.1 choice-of-anchor H family protein [Shewanella sp. E94]WBJ94031.1 choice-of-anchor H family protein [Shewanella sp. MTB7]